MDKDQTPLFGGAMPAKRSRRKRPDAKEFWDPWVEQRGLIVKRWNYDVEFEAMYSAIPRIYDTPHEQLDRADYRDRWGKYLTSKQLRRMEHLPGKVYAVAGSSVPTDDAVYGAYQPTLPFMDFFLVQVSRWLKMEADKGAIRRDVEKWVSDNLDLGFTVDGIMTRLEGVVLLAS